MLTRIDHVMICVPDLQRGIDAYTRLGFNVSPGGVRCGPARTTPSRFTRRTTSNCWRARPGRVPRRPSRWRPSRFPGAG